MKASKVYLEAARLCAESEIKDFGAGACSAIAEAKYPNIHHFDAYERASAQDEMQDFCEIFKPTDSVYGYWGDRWGDVASERRNCRTISLCFMAAIAQAEGK